MSKVVNKSQIEALRAAFAVNGSCDANVNVKDGVKAMKYVIKTHVKDKEILQSQLESAKSELNKLNSTILTLVHESQTAPQKLITAYANQLKTARYMTRKTRNEIKAIEFQLKKKENEIDRITTIKSDVEAVALVEA